MIEPPDLTQCHTLLFTVRYVRIGHVDYSLNPPGGETFEQLHERARRFLERTLELHGGKMILLFGHENCSRKEE
jgi:broad specificity phosphatase PhoE